MTDVAYLSQGSDPRGTSFGGVLYGKRTRGVISETVDNPAWPYSH